MTRRDQIGPIVEGPRRKYRVMSKDVPFMSTDLIKLVKWSGTERMYIPADGVIPITLGHVLDCYDVQSPDGIVHLVCDQFGDVLAFVNPKLLQQFISKDDPQYTIWFDEV